ncbi:hypothetical protein [Algivirga pacifica]
MQNTKSDRELNTSQLPDIRLVLQDQKHTLSERKDSTKGRGIFLES